MTAVALEGGSGDVARDGESETDDIDVRESAVVMRDVQNPTPGLRWRSNTLTEFWTLRSSSRRVCIVRQQPEAQTPYSYLVMSVQLRFPCFAVLELTIMLLCIRHSL